MVTLTSARWIALIAVMGAASACAVDGTTGAPDDGRVAQTAQGIMGGQLVPSLVYPADAVVRFTPHDCTGVKIGKRRILTAAQCVIDDLEPGKFVLISNLLNPNNWDNSTIYWVDAIHVHPSYDKPVTQFGRGPQRAYDVATIDVTTDFPDSWPTLALHKQKVESGTVPAKGTMFGYGCDSKSNGHWGLKQRKAVSLMTLGDYLEGPSEDVPTNINDFFYNMGTDGGSTSDACEGDEGGPLLMFTDSETWEVAGVVGTHPNDVTRFARVANIVDWIQAPAKNVFTEGQKGVLLSGRSNWCLTQDQDKHGEQSTCGNRTDDPGLVWPLHALGDGYFQLKNGSGLCLGIENESIANGALTKAAACEAHPGTVSVQAWKPAPNGDGRFRFINRASQRCLGAIGGSTKVWTAVGQLTCDGSLNQGWDFVR